MRMLVLALGHYLQGEAWPDCVERLVVEHDFGMFRLSFGLFSRFTMLRGFSKYLVHDVGAALANTPALAMARPANFAWYGISFSWTIAR